MTLRVWKHLSGSGRFRLDGPTGDALSIWYCLPTGLKSEKHPFLFCTQASESEFVTYRHVLTN